VSNNPGVTKVLDLLDRLKGTIRDFAEREERLEQDFRAKTVRESRQRDAALEELATRLADETLEADAKHHAARQACDAAYEKRKARINKARQTSKEQTQAKIENKTGHRKYDLQKQMLQAERDREANLSSVATTCQEFKTNLAVEDQSLVHLVEDAQAAFRGYGNFRRRLTSANENANPNLAPDENQLLAQLRDLLNRTRDDLKRFGGIILARLFRYLPVWLLLIFCPTPIVLKYLGKISMSLQMAELFAVGLIGLVLIMYFAGRGQAAALAARITDALGSARRIHDACLEKSDAHYHQDIQRAKDDFQNKTQSIDQQLKLALKEALELKGTFREKIDDKTVRVNNRNERWHQQGLERVEREHTEGLAGLRKQADVRKEALIAASAEREGKFNAERETQWQELEAEWKQRVLPIYAELAAANEEAQRMFPAWENPAWANWTPPAKFEQAAKFGRIDVDLEKLCESTPKNLRLGLPGSSCFSLPLTLIYPQQGSVLLETANTGHDEMVATLNNIILRLLSVSPPGRLNFTIIDPVGLGQNFAGVMHLADFEERLINSRIWTQSGQIEEKLGDLNEHMEKIIQMYLRNEYATIAEYNEQAGDIAEKYHFLVVADFPVNFSETAVKRLLSIAASGARCGVFTLIHWDRRQPMPQDFVPDELMKGSVWISCKGKDYLLSGQGIPGATVALDSPPTPEFATEFIQNVGRNSRDSSRVEVPFAHVAPPEAEVWSEDTTNELRVPIGRTGATKLQYLAIGKGTRQHALVAGKTGSGKSTLFHVMVTNLSLWCSPEQVEFYLIDFKKGVEFKCYGTWGLPHARVVAIESDREFGLSVLQRVDDELRRRGDLFRKFGAQDIAGYKRAGGTEPIPRSILLIDEFQEFFVEDDKVSQTAAMLLDRIVRQGRAFGIHVILGSQTLGGAYTLARTTLGQMVIRIALQCNEADAYLIMDDNNPAPRLLSRPGEGIYNDTAGSIEGNSPFQAVWLPDEVRDSYLEKVRERAARNGGSYPGPIVFEGNAPADVRENHVLAKLLAPESAARPAAARVWLGAPNSIKGPTEAVFQRQSGSHLLIVGQREESALAMLSIALVSLAAQFPLGDARFILLDGNAPGTSQSEFMGRIVKSISHEVTAISGGELSEAINGLAEELKRRADATDAASAPTVFLFINGIQKFKKLRYEEDFSFSTGDADAAPNPAVQLNAIVTEGASLGIHVIVASDTFNNVNRFISRKALTEFEMRVLFQMSASDSASLIDSPRANTLGLHRAVFYNEHEGYLEVFRPYALPDSQWVEAAGNSLSRKIGGVGSATEEPGVGSHEAPI
jgi:S-DNA-T family DNA segregation ATPase FtsK/SpoIIIE